MPKIPRDDPPKKTKFKFSEESGFSIELLSNDVALGATANINYLFGKLLYNGGVVGDVTLLATEANVAVPALRKLGITVTVLAPPLKGRR